MTSELKQRIAQVAELGAMAAILGLHLAAVKPFSAGTLFFLFPLGVVSLLLRRGNRRDFGLTLPANWRRQIILGVVAAVCFAAYSALIEDPVLTSFGLEAAHVEGLTKLASGSWVGLLATLAVVWVVGAVAEEITYRGFLLKRVRDILGGRTGVVAGVLLSGAYFGLSHWYQGPLGVIQAGSSGLFFGLLYVASGYNLLLPMVAHGVFDTVGVIMLTLGYK